MDSSRKVHLRYRVKISGRRGRPPRKPKWGDHAFNGNCFGTCIDDIYDWEEVLCPLHKEPLGSCTKCPDCYNCRTNGGLDPELAMSIAWWRKHDDPED